ncbi:MAG: hypothetical protein CMF48_06905 [Legionellales bacterium]|nr:hypothetical protein [Legionellales bacterium]|tara:strand:+ start:419 stop:1015 length:597 start_codon:yes stop_codon:yes gene_type:complete
MQFFISISTQQVCEQSLELDDDAFGQYLISSIDAAIVDGSINLSIFDVSGLKSKFERKSARLRDMLASFSENSPHILFWLDHFTSPAKHWHRTTPGQFANHYHLSLPLSELKLLMCVCTELVDANYVPRPVTKELIRAIQEYAENALPYTKEAVAAFTPLAASARHPISSPRSPLKDRLFSDNITNCDPKAKPKPMFS